MRDFVEDVWKIASACAAGAFLLSLVVGLIVGNPFGIAVFRGLLMAVVFAGLAAGLRFVVKVYLPELIGTSSAPGGGVQAAGSAASRGAASTEAYRGAAVDIELPEDDELRRQAYGGGRKEGSGDSARPPTGSPEEEPRESAGHSGPEEASEAEPLDEGVSSEAEAQALGELAEELAEGLPPARTSSVAGRGGGAGEGAAEEAETEEAPPGSRRESSGGLDSLPDIADLEPAEEGPGPAVPRTPGPAPRDSPRDAVRNSLSGQDPLTLARAIRTALKKDEKG